MNLPGFDDEVARLIGGEHTRPLYLVALGPR
jgi:hypothetical protein